MVAYICPIRFSPPYADIGQILALHPPLALLRLAEGHPSSFQRARLSSGRRELRFLEKSSSLCKAHPVPNTVESRKSGRNLPKVWPRKKKPVSPPCKPVYVAWQRQGRYLQSSVVFVTRVALQANLPMWPNFR